MYEYVCFNPSCKQFGLRFLRNRQIQAHNECTGWVIKFGDIGHILYPKSKSTPTNRNTDINFFQFKKQPMKSLFLIQNLFSSQQNNSSDNNTFDTLLVQQTDPIAILKSQFNQIRVKLQSQLQRVFYQVQSRVVNIRNMQEKTIKQITQIVSLKDEHKISKRIEQSEVLKEYEQYCRVLDSLTLVKQGRILKEVNKIFESVQNIGRGFWNTELDSIKRQKQLLQKAKRDFHSSFDDPEIHPALRLQSLVNFYSTKNIQPQVSVDKLSVSMNCWLCPAVCEGQGKNLKQLKSTACSSLITHILNQHQINFAPNFHQSMLKKCPSKISYSQFLQQIEEKPYTQFIIIDRENQNRDILSSLNLFTQKQDYSQTFILDVVSGQNQNLAIGKYLTAQSQGKDSADVMIVMVVCSVVMSGYFIYASKLEHKKKPKIIIVTKDHFAQTFKEILFKQFGVQIEIRKQIFVKKDSQ